MTDVASPSVAALVSMVSDHAHKPRIHHRKICLFLGAGADISSGGLTFAEFKLRALGRFLRRPMFDVTQSETIEREFEVLFANLRPDERAGLVEDLFRQLSGLEPSEAYKLIVLLVEAGAIDAVVTTNFDLMLETAQSLLGRDLLQVYAPGFARPFTQMSDRYAAPKRPYLKLHGDLASHSVTALLRTELEEANYDTDTLSLLRSILVTHDLIIVGYGGYDGALAQVIAEAVEPSATRIYWCGPKPPHRDAPLRLRLGTRVAHIELAFDDLVTAIARPVLERPSMLATEPTFVTSLFEWRVDYCNREYAKLNAQRDHRDISETFARRRRLEEALTHFLEPNKPLAIVTGPSGYGKTTLGLRLLRAWARRRPTRLLLLRARTFPENGDLEQHVGEQLGGLGLKTPFSFHRFEQWLTRSNLQLVVYVDGVNEFSDDIGRCAAFLRGILRFCYFLPEVDSAIRIVTTVRQETWNAMLPRLDFGQLQHAVWSPNQAGAFETLACDAFSDDELREAVQRSGSKVLRSGDLELLPAGSFERLKDPFLFRIASEGEASGVNLIPSPFQVMSTIEAKLRNSASPVSPASFMQALASAAMIVLEGKRQVFREIDLPSRNREETLRLARDLDLVRDAGHGVFQFDHDRTLEYFLAVALANGLGPPLEDLGDLEAFLKVHHANGRAIAAARLHCELNPQLGLALVADGLRQAGRNASLEATSVARLFDFARELLVQLAEYEGFEVKAYLGDAIEAGTKGQISETHLKAVVQATAALSLSISINLLSRVQHPASDLPRTEAQIYAIDRLAETMQTSSARDLDLLVDQPFATFLSDAALRPWQRLGRLASLAMQLGPDNTHPDEYAALSASLLAGWRCLVAMPTKEDPVEFSTFFLKNCDRLMFNATPEGIRRFFANPRRVDFLDVLRKLRGGAVMTIADFDRLEPFTQSIEFDIEYHLVAVLVVLSSLADTEHALALTETAFQRLGADANPVQIDFLEEILVYIHVLHARPYDEARFGSWEEAILRDHTAVLLHRPGLQRGERRGFADLFDRIFEDGFGVIYPYGVLKPSGRRRQLKRAEYIQAASAPDDDPLPMYTRALEDYLKEGRVEESLQLIQALAGIIIPWPFEGLAALRPAIGHPEPRIRRAVVRVLAEAYNRHAAETLRFLRAAGLALNDDELLEIKVRSDARVGRRQISEEEYARLAHLLLMMDDFPQVVCDCLTLLLEANSFEDAVAAIFRRVGWTT